MIENIDSKKEINNKSEDKPVEDNTVINNTNQVENNKIENDKKLEGKHDNLKNVTQSNQESKLDNEKESNKTQLRPKKDLPIEKLPFQEFINIHLIPALTKEINHKGLEINNINLKNTNRPIAEDKCWVINCEIKDTCTFWLSFEKDDISSLKSISLSKPNQKPSIIESFLIDEKRITLKLIISRVLQRLNGQKLLGVN